MLSRYIALYEGLTHLGRARSGNEDELMCAGAYLPAKHGEASFRGQVTAGERGALFGAFDGMGGEAFGEEAAFLAAKAAAAADPGAEDMAAGLLRSVHEMNRAVCDWARKEGVAAMGTTAVMIGLTGTEAVICNIGDSRAYLFRDGVGNMSLFSSITTGVQQINSFFGTIMSNIGAIMWASSVEILIFLAALQSVPATLYEVVEIDGASAWETFWHVTLPYISPFVILNCVYALVDSFVSSDNPVMAIMNSMTQEGTKYGQASALSWLYMLATLTVIMIFILLTRRWLK